MDGFLCGDCHIEKTKEFVLKKQEEKKNFDDGHNLCALCNKDLTLQIDKNKPKWQWNIDIEGALCKNCYEKKEAEYNKMINFCAICNNKIGFIRYNPKPKWKIKGQLCKECWDTRNQTRIQKMIFKKIRCEVCKKTFTKIEELMQHEQVIHGKNLLYDCRQCNMFFTGMQQMRDHIKKFHSYTKMRKDDLLTSD